MNNDGTGFLFLTKRSQEAHSCSTQRLRWFRQEQKDKPECSRYFMHVSKERGFKANYQSTKMVTKSKGGDRQVS